MTSPGNGQAGNPAGNPAEQVFRSPAAHAPDPGAVAPAPQSSWSWPALAAVILPGLALALAALL